MRSCATRDTVCRFRFLCPLRLMSANASRLLLFSLAVSLAVTGFGNIVAPCIARKSLKTTSKNPTYSDRVVCGGEAGI